jgi:hypothetical protein
MRRIDANTRASCPSTTTTRLPMNRVAPVSRITPAIRVHPTRQAGAGPCRRREYAVARGNVGVDHPELFTVTVPPLVLIDSMSPLTALVELTLTTSAAITLPRTT